MIDEETPDADKLDALKAMFYSVNKVGIDDVQRIVNYQLFQIAKRLSSNQLLTLKAAKEAESAREFGRASSQGFISWEKTIAARLGHELSGLVKKEEATLIEQQLIVSPGFPNNSSRLTDLGQRFCENIHTYHIETKTE